MLAPKSLSRAPSESLLLLSPSFTFIQSFSSLSISHPQTSSSFSTFSSTTISAPFNLASSSSSLRSLRSLRALPHIQTSNFASTSTSTSDFFKETLQEVEGQKTEPEKVEEKKKNERKIEVSATRKNIPCSWKKLHLVSNLISGLSYNEAVTQLTFCRKRAAREVLKLVHHVRFNAQNNHDLDPDRLVIVESWVGKGEFWHKRLRYHARGRTGLMIRRSAHLTVVMREISRNLWSESGEKSERKEIRLGKAGWRNETRSPAEENRIE